MLPTTSIANDSRYCVWLLTCARSTCAYAPRRPLSTLHDQFSLAATLHPAAHGEHDHDPIPPAHRSMRADRSGSALDEDVERELNERRKRRPEDDRERRAVRK